MRRLLPLAAVIAVGAAAGLGIGAIVTSDPAPAAADQPTAAPTPAEGEDATVSTEPTSRPSEPPPGETSSSPAAGDPSPPSDPPTPSGDAAPGRVAHPEPLEQTDRRTRRAHRQLIRRYLEAAYTFTHADRIGGYHHRADELLHPDNPLADAGTLIADRPRAGETITVEISDMALVIDYGTRTVWNVTTHPVRNDGTATTPLPGREPVTSRIIVTDWIEQPRILSQTLSPQPAP